MMHDTKEQALRRFCYIVSAVLLAIGAAGLLGLLFLREASTGMFVCIILLVACGMYLQFLVADRLAAYLDTGIRYYLKRFSLCSIILLLAFLLHLAGKLTPDTSILLMVLAYPIPALADIVHSLRKMQRNPKE